MKTAHWIGLTALILFCSSPAYGQNLPPPSNEEMKAYVPEGVTFSPDIAYRQGNDAWKLDLYMPAAGARFHPWRRNASRR